MTVTSKENCREARRMGNSATKKHNGSPNKKKSKMLL